MLLAFVNRFGRVMKWMSGVAGIAFVVGVFMVREGQVASSMKAENREALILYGLFICLFYCMGIMKNYTIALFRRSLNSNPPDTDAE